MAPPDFRTHHPGPKRRRPAAATDPPIWPLPAVLAQLIRYSHQETVRQGACSTCRAAVTPFRHDGEMVTPSTLVKLASADQVFLLQALGAGSPTTASPAQQPAARRRGAARSFGGVSLSWRALRGLFDLGGGALVSGGPPRCTPPASEPGPSSAVLRTHHSVARSARPSSAGLGLDRTVRPGPPTTSGTRTVIRLLGASARAPRRRLDGAYRPVSPPLRRWSASSARSVATRASVNDLDAVLELRSAELARAALPQPGHRWAAAARPPAGVPPRPPHRPCRLRLHPRCRSWSFRRPARLRRPPAPAPERAATSCSCSHGVLLHHRTCATTPPTSSPRYRALLARQLTTAVER